MVARKSVMNSPFSLKSLFVLGLAGSAVVLAANYNAVAQTQAPQSQNSAKANALVPKTQKRKKVRFVSSNWNVQCQPNNVTKKLVCVLFREIKTAKSKKLILRVSISAAPHRFTLHLPHGLDLSAGVGVKVNDDKPIIIPFKTSSRRGAFTNWPLSPELLASMKKEGKMVVTVKSVRGQRIAIPVSLTGFSVSFEKLK